MNSNQQFANYPTIQPVEVEVIELVSDSDSDDTREVMLIEPEPPAQIQQQPMQLSDKDDADAHLENNPAAPNLQSNGVNRVSDSDDDEANDEGEEEDEFEYEKASDDDHLYDEYYEYIEEGVEDEEEEEEEVLDEEDNDHLYDEYYEYIEEGMEDEEEEEEEVLDEEDDDHLYDEYYEYIEEGVEDEEEEGEEVLDEEDDDHHHHHFEEENDGRLGFLQGLNDRNPELHWDKFCMKCHYEGKLIHCWSCPLGWHSDCSAQVFEDKAEALIKTFEPAEGRNGANDALKKDQEWISKLIASIPDKVCIECARKELGYQFNLKQGIYDFMLSDRTISTQWPRLACVFKYAISSLSFQTNNTQKEEKTFPHFERIDYGDVGVLNEVDFEKMRQKSQRGFASADSYMCTEDFMFDIKLLCHSYTVLQRKSGKTSPIEMAATEEQCTELVKWALIEKEAIDLCHSCYRNRYEVKKKVLKDDRVMPCEDCHSLVWAKHDNMWLPAKVYPYRETYYFYQTDYYVWVTFFGVDKKYATQYLRVNGTNIKRYSSSYPTRAFPSSEEKFELLSKASHGANQYISFWNKYYNRNYDLHVKCEDFSIEDLYGESDGLKKGIDHFGDCFNLVSVDKKGNEKKEVQPVTRGVKRNGAATIGNVPKKSKN